MFKKLTKRFRSPIGVKLELKKKSFQLGDEIEFDICLIPHSNLNLKQVRIDLECEERYVESYTRQTQIRYKTGILKRTEAELIDTITEHPTRELREAFIHSTTALLKNRKLVTQQIVAVHSKMTIGTNRPPHSTTGSLTWTIVATAELTLENIRSDTQNIEVNLG